jgi:hypothetical protein
MKFCTNWWRIRRAGSGWHLRTIWQWPGLGVLVVLHFFFDFRHVRLQGLVDVLADLDCYGRGTNRENERLLYLETIVE